MKVYHVPMVAEDARRLVDALRRYEADQTKAADVAELVRHLVRESGALDELEDETHELRRPR